MVTIGEFVSSIRNPLKATGQESFLTNRLIYALALKHARWLANRKDSANVMSKFSNVAQTLELVDLEEVDAIRTLKIPVQSGQTWMRTKNKLPALFIGVSGPLIKEVVTIDFMTRFRLTDAATYRRIARSSRKKYMVDPYAILEDGHLYFSDNCIEGIALTGAFEEDISHLNDSSLACRPRLERLFPIPGRIQAEIESHLKQSDLSMLLNIPEDPQEDNKNMART